jgi:hypothetical protein
MGTDPNGGVLLPSTGGAAGFGDWDGRLACGGVDFMVVGVVGVPMSGVASVRGASSGALRTKYRSRAMGSTALNPSSRSSIEKPVIGPLSVRRAREHCSARCQVSAATQYDCLSVFPIELTSTNQRMGDRAS